MSQAPRDTTTRRLLPDGLSESEVHELLADERRRLVLDSLAERSGAVDVAELAATVTKREDGSQAPDRATRKSVEADLHHRQLPRLADVGIIDYDRDSHEVELRDSCS